MIEVSGLTVRIGGVTALDDVTVTFQRGVCGLVGPNGAGKTTLLNVLSGFVRPSSGEVAAFGDALLAMPHFRRARWGLRRTFQQEQAIEELSVADNVAMVDENVGRRSRRERYDAVQSALSLVGIEADAAQPVGTLGMKERRLVEVARAVVGDVKVILLDEPAAGLPGPESAQLGELIRRIPNEIGALVVLVEHDIDLVSACCETTAVLDFGRLISAGPTAEVLRDEHVVRAYLGSEEVS